MPLHKPNMMALPPPGFKFPGFLSNIAGTFAWHLSICTIEADTATENHDYHQDTDAGQFFTPSYEARAQHVD
jgi:hypothetical protein